MKRVLPDRNVRLEFTVPLRHSCMHHQISQKLAHTFENILQRDAFALRRPMHSAVRNAA